MSGFCSKYYPYVSLMLSTKYCYLLRKQLTNTHQHKQFLHYVLDDIPLESHWTQYQASLLTLSGRLLPLSYKHVSTKLFHPKNSNYFCHYTQWSEKYKNFSSWVRHCANHLIITNLLYKDILCTSSGGFCWFLENYENMFIAWAPGHFSVLQYMEPLTSLVFSSPVDTICNRHSHAFGTKT